MSKKLGTEIKTVTFCRFAPTCTNCKTEKHKSIQRVSKYNRKKTIVVNGNT